MVVVDDKQYFPVSVSCLLSYFMANSPFQIRTRPLNWRCVLRRRLDRRTLLPMFVVSPPRVAAAGSFRLWSRGVPLYRSPLINAISSSISHRHQHQPADAAVAAAAEYCVLNTEVPCVADR